MALGEHTCLINSQNLSFEGCEIWKKLNTIFWYLVNACEALVMNDSQLTQNVPAARILEPNQRD